MTILHVKRLAYCLWQQRGMPLGSPDIDWYLAEELIKGKCKAFERRLCELPLYAFGIEKRTR